MTFSLKILFIDFQFFHHKVKWRSRYDRIPFNYCIVCLGQTLTPLSPAVRCYPTVFSFIYVRAAEKVPASPQSVNYL